MPKGSIFRSTSETILGFQWMDNNFTFHSSLSLLLYDFNYFQSFILLRILEGFSKKNLIVWLSYKFFN